MKTTIIAAAGLSAALFSVAPTFGLAAETDTNATTFKAMTEVAAAVPLNDQELSAIEGQGGCGCCCGGAFLAQSQNGLVNVGVQANDVNVASGNNIASGNNVAILSIAKQFSYLTTVQ
jgi:hypothetical protein